MSVVSFQLRAEIAFPCALGDCAILPQAFCQKAKQMEAGWELGDEGGCWGQGTFQVLKKK